MSDIAHWQAALRAHWQRDDVLLQLVGELDLNFSAGDAVLKIMRANVDPALVDMQVQCLKHLAGYDLPIPEVIETSTGGSSCRVIGPDGREHIGWLISKLPGTELANVTPRPMTLIREIGATMARLHSALEGFTHPALDRPVKWDSTRTLEFRDSASHLSEHPHYDALQVIFEGPAKDALVTLAGLDAQPIHNDFNDWNIFARCDACALPTLSGIIDFGDMLRAPPVVDISIAALYLMLDQSRPVDVLQALIAGYCAERPLDATSLELIWPLALTRLALSALHANESRAAGDDDPYLQISQAPVNEFLQHFASLDPYRTRVAALHAGGKRSPSISVITWLNDPSRKFAPVFETPLNDAPILDLSITGDDNCDNPVSPEMEDIERAVQHLTPRGGGAVIGRYAEPRLVYGAPFYLSGDHGASDRRTIHIAIDVFLPAGTALHAPLDATVHSAEVCDAEYDYGGLVVLRHEPEPGLVFYTLYGHLEHASARMLTVGQEIAAGTAFAWLGAPAENGGWPPHVHFQVGLTALPGSRWPGVVDPDELADWREVFPDPASLLGLSPGHASGDVTDVAEVSRRRAQHSPANLSLSYNKPVHIVRGWKNLLFDDRGRTYLDAYNNVPHVGHSHPQIRTAIDRQLRLLNTNTRYLQKIHADYTQALTALLPDALSVCYLLSSGSEANELALRLARAATGAKDTIVLAAGYHGHTATTIDISHYKFAGPGGDGQRDWVHVAGNPDTFRMSLDPANPDSAGVFVADVESILASLSTEQKKPACFMAETFPSVGGQLVPPPGYLQQVYAAVRGAGGLCIADEVQTGLGRLGHHFWGFEQQGVVPDIVVLGKPLGNGYPLAAVITTQQIAAAFDTGMEFFATFGGASVACAAGHEVLRIIEEEGLQQNAAEVGDYLQAGLRALADQYPLLADVRGCGLFLGVEIADAEKRPLPLETAYIVNRLRDYRVLIGSDGPDHNVLKIRPPLCFERADADHLLSRLDAVLGENALRT